MTNHELSQWVGLSTSFGSWHHVVMQ